MLPDIETTYATPTLPFSGNLPPSGKYIVKFKDPGALEKYIERFPVGRGPHGLIMQQYKSFDCVAGKFDEEMLETLRHRSDIEAIEHDKPVGIDAIQWESSLLNA